MYMPYILNSTILFNVGHSKLLHYNSTLMGYILVYVFGVCPCWELIFNCSLLREEGAFSLLLSAPEFGSSIVNWIPDEGAEREHGIRGWTSLPPTLFLTLSLCHRRNPWPPLPPSSAYIRLPSFFIRRSSRFGRCYTIRGLAHIARKWEGNIAPEKYI